MMKQLLDIRIITLILVSCLVVGNLTATAQSEVGTLQMVVHPSNTYMFRVDTTLYTNVNHVDLAPGTYAVTVWAPNYLAADTTVVIEAKQENKVVVFLKDDPLYVKHVSKLKWNKRARQATLFAPCILTGYFAFREFFLWKNARHFTDRAHYYRNEYEASTIYYETNYLRGRFYESRDSLHLYNDRLKTNNYLLGGSALITLGAIWLVRRKFKTPVYKPKNPLIPDDMGAFWDSKGVRFRLVYDF